MNEGVNYSGTELADKLNDYPTIVDGTYDSRAPDSINSPISSLFLSKCSNSAVLSAFRHMVCTWMHLV